MNDLRRYTHAVVRQDDWARGARGSGVDPFFGVVMSVLEREFEVVGGYDLPSDWREASGLESFYVLRRKGKPI